ncbi:hypothetical protein [Peribacillus asahii]|uniref:hypothetical protein n=1 Tax=Peribacillus asahii TaxID=228899 RepID=UPI00207AA446|nr:hypothetical protein [Peribacillus asahii]USK72673.1 hypothetical protein LIS76_23410 [Peribacillus asahii]USK72710.1 hypothetical protein LIS76_23990 [Peribacillus asahii]
MTRVGGQSPDSYGLSVTVTVPAATAGAPVKTNEPLKWGAGAYEAVKAVADDVIALVAKHPVEDGLTPLGAWVAGGNSRVHVFTYSGTAPTVGGSVVADGLGGVKSTVTANSTRVLYVNTARQQVEVLI